MVVVSVTQAWARATDLRNYHAAAAGLTQDIRMYRVSQKKCDLETNGHNTSEIHQKGKKLVCFGKFSINAAG